MFSRIQDLHDTETAACFSHAGSGERTFEVSQSTQQAQCFGLIVPMLNRNSRLYGPVFSTTMPVRRGISPRCWPEYQSRSWCRFFHPRSQQGDFDRVKIHVLVSMFLKPCQVLSERSGQHSVYRYDPAAIHQRTSHQIPFSEFDLFTEFDRTFNGTVDQTLTALPFIIAAAVSVDATIP